MSTVEKLFVQIFERKRWIIEHLKQQKQIYDQHLASKLLIQGITPPPWLLNLEFPSSTSDLTALNKEELISGLLLPQPPSITYPSTTCFLYDKSVAAALNDELPHATCASSNGSEEDEPGNIPSSHIDDSEDGAGIFPQCHVDDSEEMLNYVPMSPDDQTDTMNSSTYLKLEESLARMQRSRSRQKALQLRNSAKASGKRSLEKENIVGISSGDKTNGCDEPLDGVKKSIELIGPSALSTCIDEEAVLGDCSNKEMRSDDPSSRSKVNEAKVVQTEDDRKMEIQSNAFVGRNTGSRSCLPQSISEGQKNSRKSHEVYIGRMTRSKSGKAQLPGNDDPRNRRVTRSCSNQIQPINENHAIRNGKINSGVITKSRSGGEKEAETKDHWSRAKNGMSVKPKQLDFDEFEQTCLADSLAEGKDNMEENTGDHYIEERSASLPCSSSADRTSQICKSLTHETQEAVEIDVDNSLPKRDRISGQTSLLLDHPPDSQGTEEHLLEVGEEYAVDPSSPGPNVDISSGLSSQKHNFEPEEEQELDKATSRISLLNANSEATMSLHRDTVEASLSLEKTRHEPSSCNDCKETSYPNLPNPDTEATLSLHPDAVEAALSLKKTRNGSCSSNDCEERSYLGLPKADAEATVSLNKDVEATLSSEKTRHDLSSHSDCKKTSHISLPNADSEATVSVHRDAAVASSEKTGHELSSCNNCKETSCIPNTDAEASMSLNQDAVKATSSPELPRHELPSCNDFKLSLETETTEHVQPSPGRNSAGSLASMLRLSSVNTPGDTSSEDASEMLKSGSHFRNTDIQTSCFSSHVEVIHYSKLPDVQTEKDVLPQYDASNAMDGSWPCYKRRKIGYQAHYKSAGPSLRVNTSPGIDENIPNKSVDGEEEDSSIPQKLIISQDLDAVLSNSEFVSRAAHGAKYLDCKEPELALKVQYEEGNERSVMMPFTCEQKRLSTSRASDLKLDTATASSDCISEGEMREAPTSTVDCTGRLCSDLESAEVVGQGNSKDELTCSKMVLDERESLQVADNLKYSIGSPLIERMDVGEANGDEIVPEFEGFIIAEKRESVYNAEGGLLNGEIPFPSKVAEYTNFPEQLPRPASLSTPASPFLTAYNLHLIPGVYHSVPNGLLENIDLTSNLLSSGKALRGKSYSDYHSFPSKRVGWDVPRPYLSPMGKGFEGIAFKSGGSDKRLSGNPELICFPIQEDPESSEEDVILNDKCGTGMIGVDSNEGSGFIREPLHDIAAINQIILDSSHAVERGSLESVTTEISISENHNKNSKKNEMQQRSRQLRQGKENQSLSIGANSIKKRSESLSSRYSKPKLSGKSSLRSRGQSLSEKEPKCNNIVSNVKSFVPLVQQKQASSVAPAKREVKVKALEAAENAKRLAEKRENERKQKKEALKLERARLEQENLKQMELKKKLKEDERKKRDAEKAARKRQREEEEKKERERKRKRMEEARCQQKQAEEKISAWREESRCETEDGRAQEKKDSDHKADRPAANEDISRNPDKLVGNDRKQADSAMLLTNDNKSSTGSSDAGKVGSIEVADISTPNCDKSARLVNQTSREQSYDISPYQCSDDEEEEEDDIPNKKFIPTWASKSCVAVALSSLKHIDPDTIFPPGSFCTLEEVLLPRRLQQK